MGHRGAAVEGHAGGGRGGLDGGHLATDAGRGRCEGGGERKEGAGAKEAAEACSMVGASRDTSLQADG